MKLERVVVMTPSLDELTSGSDHEPCPLLDDDAGVIRFLEEHAPRLDDAAAVRDAAFASLRGLADPEGEPDIGVEPADGGRWRVTIHPPGGEPVRLVVREGRLRPEPGSGGRK